MLQLSYTTSQTPFHPCVDKNRNLRINLGKSIKRQAVGQDDSSEIDKEIEQKRRIET